MNFSGSLDTSAILRLILGDIPNQRELVANLIAKSREQIAVSDIAIAETVFVLAREYGISRQEISDIITAFMNIATINCNRVLIDEALKLFVMHPALSFEDCTLTTYANLNDATPLYTFDKKLAHQLTYARLIAS